MGTGISAPETAAWIIVLEKRQEKRLESIHPIVPVIQPYFRWTLLYVWGLAGWAPWFPIPKNDTALTLVHWFCHIVGKKSLFTVVFFSFLDSK